MKKEHADADAPTADPFRPSCVIEGNGIVLRQWRDDDLGPLAEMNADAEVMRYFPKLLTLAESTQFLYRMRAGIDEKGWGLWAVEVEGAFSGFTGLSVPKFTAHFTPRVEIGWRFRREYWGRSLAYAAAQAAEAFAFQILMLPELVTFTAAINTRSRRLMERLGFSTQEQDNFPHPLLAQDSPLSRHVLYRKSSQIPAQAVAEGAPTIHPIGSMELVHVKTCPFTFRPQNG